MTTKGGEDGVKAADVGRNLEDLKEDLSRALEDALRVFRHLWEEIGIVDAQRAERTAVIVFHLRSLLDEMVGEERALKDKLIRNVESYRDELARLAQELSLQPPHFEVVMATGESMPILQQERELRQRVAILDAERTERMCMLKNLREADQCVCDILCVTPFYVPSGAVPTRDQLAELEGHVTSLTREKEERYRDFIEHRRQIMAIFEDIGQDPCTSFELGVAVDEPECFVLSLENMEGLASLLNKLKKQQSERLAHECRLREKLATLWQRLDVSAAERKGFTQSHSGHRMLDMEALQLEIARCEELRLQQAKRFIECIRVELVDWWDRCYFSDKQRAVFEDFGREDFCEDLLVAHEQELERVKAYYEANKEMLLKVERRSELWARMLEFDARERDPARYTNRGGGLLKEEKERKKILRDLPKVEEQLKDSVEMWEQANGRDFLCNGVKFTDFCRQQWEDYHRCKEEEKQERQKMKNQEANAEAMFGSKPQTTPCKRRLNGVAGSGATTTQAAKAAMTTPAKQRKLNDMQSAAPHTPLSVTRTAPRSVFASPVTTLPPRHGVLTSSTAKLNDAALTRTPGTATAGLRTPGTATAGLRTPKSTATAVQPVCAKIPGGAATVATNDKLHTAHATRIVGVLGERQNIEDFLQASPRLPPMTSTLSYHEFKVGLNEQSKQNWRSSELPQK